MSQDARGILADILRQHIHFDDDTQQLARKKSGRAPDHNGDCAAPQPTHHSPSCDSAAFRLRMTFRGNPPVLDIRVGNTRWFTQSIAIIASGTLGWKVIGLLFALLA